MDSVQIQHEKAVGDKFIGWYNAKNKTKFLFCRRTGEAPDLVHVDKQTELKLEIVDAYYDQRDAAFQWQGARRVRNAPEGWRGKNFNERLVGHINHVLAAKCQKSYGPGCALVVNVQPALTTAEELESMLPLLHVPARNPFVGVYLTGNFPVSSSGSSGGYRCWKLA